MLGLLITSSGVMLGMSAEGAIPEFAVAVTLLGLAGVTLGVQLRLRSYLLAAPVVLMALAHTHLNGLVGVSVVCLAIAGGGLWSTYPNCGGRVSA